MNKNFQMKESKATCIRFLTSCIDCAIAAAWLFQSDAPSSNTVHSFATMSSTVIPSDVLAWDSPAADEQNSLHLENSRKPVLDPGIQHRAWTDVTEKDGRGGERINSRRRRHWLGLGIWRERRSKEALERKETIWVSNCWRLTTERKEWNFLIWVENESWSFCVFILLLKP